MKLYFSSNHFEQLQRFNFKERQQIIELANNKLPATSKFVLNLLKLFLLIPPFLLIAKVDSWLIVLPLLLVLAMYFVVLKPISLWFISKYLDKAIRQFEQHRDS